MRPCGLVLFFVLAVSVSLPLQAAILPSERAALEAIYNSTGGTGWKVSTNWMTAPGSECTWAGVRCNEAQTTVIELALGWNTLTGTIPPQIGNLTNLEVLYLPGNPIGGTIPSQIGQLIRLKKLVIYYTGTITGPIPSSIGQLTDLVELNLGLNKLTGPIPATLGQLTKLELLELGANLLEGPIPPSLANLTNLRKFNLQYNKLTGTIPANLFAGMTRLEELLLESNRLEGPIPTQFAHMQNLTKISFYASGGLTGNFPPELTRLPRLEKLALGRTQLSGMIPETIGDLTSLKVLGLDGCQFSGEIPRTLVRLVNLERLYLSGNELTGTIPPNLDSLTKLVTLALGSNNLEGSIPVELSRLPLLNELSLGRNQLTGEIPPQLGNLRELSYQLDLSNNRLVGPIPPELGQLSKVTRFYLYGNGLTGSIPPQLEGMTEVTWLRLDFNDLTGEIPTQLGNLKKLRELFLKANQLSGTIPETLGGLPLLEVLELGGNSLRGPLPAALRSLSALKNLRVNDNDLSGPIPDFFGDLPNLEQLYLSNNRFSDALPASLGQLSKLKILWIQENELTGPLPSTVGGLTSLIQFLAYGNSFSGELPPALGNLSNLETLGLTGNRLTGAVPASLGNLTKLKSLRLESNALRGALPASLMNLSNLSNLGLRRNALTTNDAALKSFLDARDREWSNYQTVTPSNVTVVATSTTMTVSWTPIAYRFDNGGYQISARFTAAESFSTLFTTANKSIPATTITGLVPGKTYRVIVNAVTSAGGNQKNTLVSDPSPEILVTTAAAGAPGPPQVVVFSFPSGFFQIEGAAAGGDRYTLTNVGETATTITLTQQGSFFTQSPATFALGPGASRNVSITGLPVSAGAYLGASIPTGAGVPAGLSIPVRMCVTPPPPAGTVTATPDASRVDVAAPVGSNPTGSVTFANSGNSVLTGIAVADVAWIIPQPGLITIPPGKSVAVSFEIRRELRTDPNGTETGRLSLVYVQSVSGKFSSVPLDGSAPGTVTSAVSVVDTVTPVINPVPIPPLLSDEIALFIPGAGSLISGNSKFLTDISISNILGLEPVTDLRMYYAPAMGSPGATNIAPIPTLAPSKAISFADVVKNVFSVSGQLGTVQIRSRSADRILVNANIFNVADPRGTYGNNIPVFRSDRSVSKGSSFYITGLRSEAGLAHTNLFIQETAGAAVSYEIAFHAHGGQRVPVSEASPTLRASIDAFRLQPHISAVPPGAVMAKITHIDGDGRIAGFATPVDDLSKDTWSLVDWNLLFGTSRTDVALIPVAGRLRGESNSFFRTDVAITNPSPEIARGVLRYYPAGSAVIETDLQLNPGETRILNDVVSTMFPSAGDSAGHVILTPRDSSFVTSSRTYSTFGTDPATTGMGVPTLSFGTALRLGQSRLISGLELARPDTIVRKKPGTFRTNVGLFETSGQEATVKLIVRFPQLSSTVEVTVTEEFEYTLGPNQFLLINKLSDAIAARRPIGDLRDVQLEFQVIRGSGTVAVFTTTLDNGSGDQLMRIE